MRPSVGPLKSDYFRAARAVPAPSPAGLAAATRPPPSVTSRLTRVPAPVGEGLMPHDAEDGRRAQAAAHGSPPPDGALRAGDGSGLCPAD